MSSNSPPKRFLASALIVGALIIGVAIYQAFGTSQVDFLPLVKPCTFQIAVINSYYYGLDCSTGGIRRGGPGNAGGISGTDFGGVFNAIVNDTFANSQGTTVFGGQGIIFIQPGQYSFADRANTYGGLTIDYAKQTIVSGDYPNLFVEGSGAGNTYLKYTGTKDAMFIGESCLTAGCSNVNNLHMKDFSIYSTTGNIGIAIGNQAEHAVYATIASYVNFENVHVYCQTTCKYAFDIWAMINSVFTNDLGGAKNGASGGSGLHLIGQSNANTVIAGQYWGKYGINITGSSPNSFWGVSTEKSSGGYGVYISSDAGNAYFVSLYLVSDCAYDNGNGDVWTNTVYAGCATSGGVITGTHPSHATGEAGIIFGAQYGYSHYPDVIRINVTSGTTDAVTFNGFGSAWFNEPTARYGVWCVPSFNSGTIWASSKTPTGFTLNWVNAAGAGNYFDCIFSQDT